MKQKGRTINKTARYTEEDVRKLMNKTMMPAIDRAAKTIHEIHLMAMRDYLTEHCPRIDINRAILDYCELIVKYTADYDAGEFTAADVRRYNRDT